MSADRLAFYSAEFPTLRNVPPINPDWLHEIKFEGYRVQLHRLNKEVVIHSRRGVDLKRYQAIRRCVAEITDSFVNVPRAVWDRGSTQKLVLEPQWAREFSPTSAKENKHER